MTVNSYADVTRQSAYHVQVFFSELFSARFFAEQHHANQTIAHHQRDQNIYLDFGKDRLVIFEKSGCFFGSVIERKRRA